MLRQLRQKKTMKRILWALAIIIIPAFVFWGAGSLVEKRANVGVIFGRNVYPSEYKNAWEAVRNEALMSYGSRFYEIADQFDLNSQAWERLIMLEEAKRKKITVPDAEVMTFIARVPFFLDPDGSFSHARYESILARTFKRIPRRFEEDMRESLIIARLAQEAAKGISVSEQEIDEALAKEKEREEANKKDNKKKAEKKETPGKELSEEELLVQKRNRIRSNLFIQKRVQALQAWRDDLYKRANLVSKLEPPAEEPSEELPEEEPTQEPTK